MYFVYSLLLSLGFLVLLPRFLFDALRQGKYVTGFRQRLGSLPEIRHESGPVIWLHCVSVGESQAARPLVQSIRRRFPNHSLVISTITVSGQNVACELFKDEATYVFYFPFDWRWTVRRALQSIRPSAVLIMETELWPRFLRECQTRQIPVALVNGRLSRQSFRRYKLIRGFISRVLASLKLAVMQSEGDADRIRRLGLSPDKVFVSGSLKFDAGAMSVPVSLVTEFRERFNLANQTTLILAASTHAPEEATVLEALKRLKTSSRPHARLLLAPRHPERFGEVAGLIEKSGLTWTRRTRRAATTDSSCDVILLDTIGELPGVYSLATVVFVGGSIVNKGGHNILEPAAVGSAIITGAHTYNFDAIVRAFVKEEAIVQLPRLTQADAAVELVRVVEKLLSKEELREELGRRAKLMVDQNLGATNKTLDLLDPVLGNKELANQQPSSITATGV